MSKINIEISGNKGLGGNWYGYADQTTPTPQSDYYTVDGKMVGGYFNPFVRPGYLSPSVATIGTTTFTGGDALAGLATTTLYDSINDDYYFSDLGGQIFLGDGLDDTSLAKKLSTTTPTRVIMDMEIYQINGVRKMFYVYKQNGALNVGKSDLPWNSDSTSTRTNLTWFNYLDLPYDTETGNFTAGLIVTGGTSGAKGEIVGINDVGTSGTLSLISVSGTFQDNETITDTSTGSAAVNGAGTPLAVAGQLGATLAGDYAFMRVANNSFAYIFADNVVYQIDGTTAGGTQGTSSTVLVFPVFYRLVDAIDYRGNMMIAVQQSTLGVTTLQSTQNNYSMPCGVYFWNKESTVISMADYIPIEGIRAIKKMYVAPNGSIRLITISSNNLTQIRQYTGSTFEVIEELGLGAAPQYNDSLTTNELLTTWLGTDGSFYAHGAIKKGETEILARIGQFKASSGDPSATISAGAVLYGGGNTMSGTTGYRTARQGFTVGYNDGSNKIGKFYPFDTLTINSNAQTSLAGGVYTPVTYFPSLSKINFIHLYFNTIPSSGAGTTAEGTISVYLNQSTTASITSSITRNDLVNGFKYIPINQGAKNAVYAMQFKIDWATNTTINDTTTFRPRSIEVDYEAITKLK